MIDFMVGMQESSCYSMQRACMKIYMVVLECCIEEQLGSDCAHSLSCADSWMLYI